MEIDAHRSGPAGGIDDFAVALDRTLRQLSAGIITEAEACSYVNEQVLALEARPPSGTGRVVLSAETVHAVATAIVARFLPRYPDLTEEVLEALATTTTDPIRDGSAAGMRAEAQGRLAQGDRDAAIATLIAGLQSQWMSSRIQDMEAMANLAVRYELPEVLIAGWPKAKGRYRGEQAWATALQALDIDVLNNCDDPGPP